MLISDSTAPIFEEICYATENAKVLKQRDVLVLSLSVNSILKIIYYRMLGRRLIYYLHEPQEITFAKLKKTDFKIFIKAYILNLANIFIILISNIIACDNKQVQGKLRKLHPRANVKILPLLYNSKEHLKCDTEKIIIGFIGRIDAKRPLPKINKKTQQIDYHVLTSSKIPANEYFHIMCKKYDDEEKDKFLQNASLICVNNFNEYSQSSVVIECLYRKKPVIVSNFDPYSHLIEQIDKRCVVRSEEELLQVISDPNVVKDIALNWQNASLLNTFHDDRVSQWRTTL